MGLWRQDLREWWTRSKRQLRRLIIYFYFILFYFILLRAWRVDLRAGDNLNLFTLALGGRCESLRSRIAWYVF